jgi:ubiquinone/menaquinone biosynthesis C-methylase UbiE
MLAATRAIELHRRFGFHVTGIDPSAAALDVARRSAGASGVAAAVDFKPGRIEAIPAEPGSIDFVWCRDTIELVADLERAFGEVSRVLRPGGWMLIYTMCATEFLSAAEAVLVIENLGVITRSMQFSYIESSITKAGLAIER